MRVIVDFQDGSQNVDLTVADGSKVPIDSFGCVYEVEKPNAMTGAWTCSGCADCKPGSEKEPRIYVLMHIRSGRVDECLGAFSTQFSARAFAKALTPDLIWSEGPTRVQGYFSGGNRDNWWEIWPLPVDAEPPPPVEGRF